jgi:hypothetical protein
MGWWFDGRYGRVWECLGFTVFDGSGAWEFFSSFWLDL